MFVYIRMRGTRPPATNEMKLETEKEVDHKSTIMEMRNIIKNQERVIEQLMFDMLNKN